jgi:membrane associated rhomboid family serine protease
MLLPLNDTIPSRRMPGVTWALIGVNVLVFWRELSLSDAQIEQLFLVRGLVPARVGESFSTYLSFFTSMFLHGGWMHLIGNMWSLYLFGDNVEDRMGHARYLIFYLLTGLIAGLTHYFTNRTAAIPTVGASGAIAGVMGAYLVLFPRARIVTLFLLVFIPLFFEVPAVLYLGLWFISQVFSGTTALATGMPTDNVAFLAHVGGFVSGIVLMPVFVRRWDD